MPFAYDVVFTRDAFDPQNSALVETVTASEPARRHRILSRRGTPISGARSRLAAFNALDSQALHAAEHHVRPLRPAISALGSDDQRRRLGVMDQAR